MTKILALKPQFIVLYTLLKKGSKKCHALTRVSNYIDTNKRRVLMIVFLKSQFSYCPLVSMFRSRTSKDKINRLYEKALRLVCRNKTILSLEDLLKEDETVNIHQRNLQILAT